MEAATPDSKTREALATVGQYLSDIIPPVQTVEPVLWLLRQSAELMASEIIRWVPGQLQGNDKGASVADYLFHAVSKLHYLVHLQLIPEQAMRLHLDSVKQLLIDYCPPEDRALLQENFRHTLVPDAPLAAPISFMYRQSKPKGSEAGTQEGRAPEQTTDRLISLLQDRLKAATQPSAMPGARENPEDAIPNLIATAASNIKNGEEFRTLQGNLESLGINAKTEQIFRALSHSLPGWMIATTGSEAATSHNPAMQAMCQIIYIAEDKWEGNKRFQNMVQAAIEQFNTGSLARAATMFDLAIGICSDDKLDPATVATFRKTAHESLDMKRLRSVAKESSKHRLLRKVLGFFDAFTVPNILDSLQKEEKRDRRRLLLDLLEAHGDAARPLVLERLKQLLGDTNVATDWYYARNLVYILNAIPPANNAPLKEEVELIAPLLRLSLPLPLVKEAIRYAGQTRSSESEDLLISTADKLEKVVFEYASSGRDATQRLSLLDRAIYALAHYGTPKSSERVVKHGVCGQAVLGDTTSRLTYLSSQDLTSDQESLSILIQFLKSKTPRKLLGMTIQKNEQVLCHAIKALSSTPAPIVRETLEKIARQFPETKFGQAAASTIKGFDPFEKPGTQTEHLLTGDLDLFGLPDLLRQLHQLNVTGELTLRDAKGVPVGIFSLIAGRMQNCSTGHLVGMEAAYQLLERPAAGTFVFQGQKNSGAMEPSEEHETKDLSTVLSEGMRRYDALLRARALVPDFALLKRRGPEPVPPTDKEDAKISDFIWKKTAAGTSPEECEAVCQADSYRIRTLLSRWVEEGVLTVE